MKSSGFAKVAKPPKGPKLKKCKICRESFMPRNMGHVACKPDCAQIHGAMVATKQKAKAQRQERAQDKVKREGMKTRSDLVREAQAVVNAYVRLRDFDKPCISCGVTYPDDRNDVWDAGHLRSAGSSPGTRFNTLNINKQCVRCNRYLSSNAIQYRIGLVKKIGLPLVEKIEFHNGVGKFSHEYLIRLKNVFKERIRHLKKLRK